MKGRDRIDSLWHLPLLLGLMVLLSAAGLVWFVTKAAENEQLAVRQELASSYRRSLSEPVQQAEAGWQQRAVFFSTRRLHTPESLFRDFVEMFRTADPTAVTALIVYDATGTPLYPAPTPFTNLAPSEADSPDYLRLNAARSHIDAAQQADQIAEAITLCQRLIKAKSEVSLDTATEDLRADIRLLMATLQHQSHAFGLPEARSFLQWAAGSSGLSSAARIRVLETAVAHAERLRAMDADLTRELDYAKGLLEAERLAAAYVSLPVDHVIVPSANARVLVLDGKPVVQVSCLIEGRRVVMLRNAADAASDFLPLLNSADKGGLDVLIRDAEGHRVLGPERHATTSFLTMPLRAAYGGWTVELIPKPGGLLTEAAGRSVRFYAWSGVGVVLLILFAGILIWRQLTRQIELNSLKSDFIATLAHELKTPVASTHALVDTLLDGRALNPEQHTEYLQLISQENARLSTLVDSFLDFSRMEKGERPFDMQPVNPADIATSAATAMQHTVEQRSCRLSQNIATDLPIITADRDAMITVLTNLLDNATKATYDHTGELELSVFQEPGAVCFSVRDNGVGLTCQQQRRVFDRFYRADAALTRQSEGCGLGLSIVKAIVSAHDGTVQVESAPGKGSTFTVRLTP